LFFHFKQEFNEEADKLAKKATKLPVNEIEKDGDRTI
jgi:hypothetical protein